jgi:GNAT superfamily N-acetyltransferase
MKPEKYLNKIASILGLPDGKVTIQTFHESKYVGPDHYNFMTNSDGSMKTYHVYVDALHMIGGFSLCQLPETNIMWSSGAFVYEKYQRKGIGAILNKLRIHMAASMGCDYILCSVRFNNHKQVGLLRKNGWQQSSFLSDTALWIRHTNGES